MAGFVVLKVTFHILIFVDFWLCNDLIMFHEVHYI